MVAGKQGSPGWWCNVSAAVAVVQSGFGLLAHPRLGGELYARGSVCTQSVRCVASIFSHDYVQASKSWHANSLTICKAAILMILIVCVCVCCMCYSRTITQSPARQARTNLMPDRVLPSSDLSRAQPISLGSANAMQNMGEPSGKINGKGCAKNINYIFNKNKCFRFWHTQASELRRAM